MQKELTPELVQCCYNNDYAWPVKTLLALRLPAALRSARGQSNIHSHLAMATQRCLEVF